MKWFLILAVWLLPQSLRAGPKELKEGIRHLAKRSQVPLSGQRVNQLATLFWKYGAKWKIDPWLAISLAWQESLFSDRPRRVLVRRCKTVIRGGSAVKVCGKSWPGERGMMQVVPRWSKKSFWACKRREWRSVVELENTETNVCVGLHLLAQRRSLIRAREAAGWKFFIRYRKRRKNWAPCGEAQRRFCQTNPKLCKKWWVASWHWGSYTMYCGGRAGRYPMKVLLRYQDLRRRFDSATRKD